jgi:hypothetical protein
MIGASSTARRSRLAVTVLALASCARSPETRALADAGSEAVAVGTPNEDVSVSPPPSDAATSSSEAAVVASLPPVAVENIGMHIGGGPNDGVTKAPIASSVAPHFERFRACWSQVADPHHGGDFGVDLLIPAEGGRASVSHPRSRLGPDAFRDCVVHVFEEVDFAKPRGGRTTVSYSLRFEPRESVTDAPR